MSKRQIKGILTAVRAEGHSETYTCREPSSIFDNFLQTTSEAWEAIQGESNFEKENQKSELA